MNRIFRNVAVLGVPLLVYWLFLAGLVSLGWHNLIKGMTFTALFGFISTLSLANQIPHAVLYFVFGFLASPVIKSDKKPFWIVALCVIRCAMQAVTHRWHFVEGVSLLTKVGTVFPQFITPWFAWLGYLVYKKEQARTSEQAVPPY